MEETTLMRYQLNSNRGADVLRYYYDDTSLFANDSVQDVAMRKLYDRVLQADSQMEGIIKSLPRYLMAGYHQDPGDKLPCYIPRQRYHLAISIAHKTLTIHRRFSLRSLTDKWYNYTKARIQRRRAERILDRQRDNSTNDFNLRSHAFTAPVRS